MEMKNVFNQKFYTEEVTENVGSIQILGGEIERTKVGYTVIFKETRFVNCDFTRLENITNSKSPEVRLVFNNCTFNDCNFSKAAYLEPVFDNCRFASCFLNDTKFTTATFIKCNFMYSEICMTLDDAMIKDSFTIAYCGTPVYVSFNKDTWVTCDINCVMSKCNITVNSSRIKGLYAMYSSLGLSICNSSIDNYFVIGKSEIHIKKMKSILLKDVELSILFSELYLAEKEIDDNSMMQFYKALKMTYTTITKI